MKKCRFPKLRDSLRNLPPQITLCQHNKPSRAERLNVDEGLGLLQGYREKCIHLCLGVTIGPSAAAELPAQQRSDSHRVSPISDEALRDVANDVNLESPSNDINSISTQGLESIVEDSMGLLSLFQEAEDKGVKSQGDKTLSRIAPMVTNPMKPINEGRVTWNEPIVLDSGNNIRASQVVGINIMVNFWPKEVNGKNRSQPVGEGMDLIESSGTSVSSEVSGYIADTPD
ncbi:hypothetical protein RHSIM_Rhsim11G0056900 [Rhododendron simsii]|uniref:Uncharacterized protein n=1 Tax=Rhododendron simsii TaxID=118357 RepID=A0A834G7M2_RHOSS|nr:hypothetical protein RHSIM_Rhsim11G0056900 [Rhododendron simsii]